MRSNKVLFIVILCILIVNVYAESAFPRSNLLQSFVPFLLLLFITHLIVKKIRKRKVQNKEKTNIEAKYITNNLQKSSIVPLCGSIVVIISFFLPWVGKQIGPQLVETSFGLFKMAEYDSSFLIVGIFILLFILSPVIFHILILVKYFGRNYIDKSLSLLPLIIWIIEVLIIVFYISSSNGGDISIPIGNGPSFGIGAIGTLIGMLITIYLVLSKKVLTSEVVNKVSTNETQYCHNCGTKLEDYSKYCPECGTDLVKEN